MTRTLRYLFILLFVSTAGISFGQGQSGSVTGTVVDETKEPVIGAVVEAIQGGIVKGGAPTDVDGKYTIKPLAPGRYDIKVSYSSYKTSLTQGVIVSPDQTTGVNVSLELNPQKLEEVVVVEYQVPLVDKYKPGGSKAMTSEEIEKLPTRNTATMASTTPGVYQKEDGQGINVAGSRSDATLYIIDGVQVQGSRGINLAQNSIDQMQVLTSGLPAKYGDALGGVITITTKGISNVLRTSILAEHSVEGYNHNLLNFSLSGPLYSKKTENGKKPVIGFALSGDGYYDEDRRPSYGGNYVLKQDVRDRLKQQPLQGVPTQTGVPSFRVASEYLHMDDFEIQKKRPDATVIEGRLNGKLDFQITDNLSITAGGNGTYRDMTNWIRAWSYLTPETMPTEKNLTARGFVRFTQRFGKGTPAAPVEGEEAPKQPLISNAYYTLQADYLRDFRKIQHSRHGGDIFKYGYVGKFYTDYTQVYAPGIDDSTGRFGLLLAQDRVANRVRFERSELNPILANYTSQYFDATNYSDITGPAQTIYNAANGGALINGQLPNYTYNPGATMYSIGYEQPTSFYSLNEQYALTADASFDFQPGKTKHSIEFGLYYQQRVNKYFNANGAAPAGSSNIWTQMRLLTNSHISLSGEPIFLVNGKRYTREDVENGVVSPSPYDTIIYDRIANTSAQSVFDKNLRAKLGVGETDYINIDELDPSIFSLDMFSADELLANGQQFVGYAGYTYTGKKQNGQVNFNDFFTKKDANGNYTRDVGAMRPNYIAGYILDKFQYKDLLFNIGLRIDRFDANTKVLKDPYSLYEVRDVASARKANLVNENGSIPSNIKDDYVVYVNSNEASTPKIIGYRNGDDWYDYQGRQIEDPNVLRNYSGGNVPQPFLVDPTVRMQDSTFNPNSSFTDYKPQVNVMPRISFSFPISDVALFYAHYDVIVQRPDNIFANPANYYFLQARSNTIIDNPDLKPQKMFDYEVGFTQQLSKRSAITVTGFYKERKDMIQVRPYLFAWPQTYYTYGNRDFSTTKGMTLRYDMRRTGNLRMDIAYTLQFAEGTGSDPESSNGGDANFVAQGSILQNFIQAQVPGLRYSTALNYDSRHMIVSTIDYRYQDKEGPVVADKHILENAGLNLIFRARSGEPYTRHRDAYQRIIQGELNGARLPWHYNVDLRVDKDFKLRFGKKPAEGADNRKVVYMNAYALIQNVTNRRDVLGVDPFTSRPDDDAVLTSAQGIQDVQKQTNPQSYIDLYTIYQINPNNVNLPRRINIGLQFNF